MRAQPVSWTHASLLLFVGTAAAHAEELAPVKRSFFGLGVGGYQHGANVLVPDGLEASGHAGIALAPHVRLTGKLTVGVGGNNTGRSVSQIGIRYLPRFAPAGIFSFELHTGALIEFKKLEESEQVSASPMLGVSVHNYVWQRSEFAFAIAFTFDVHYQDSFKGSSAMTFILEVTPW